MARNWLCQSLLPAKFWFFALKRVCEICNILPTDHSDSITTPHQLVYREKVDYRCLFPLFSVAYIKEFRQNGHKLNKWESHSLKCIVIGKCPQSDGLLFYHPPSKQVLTSATYKFDTFLPAGPQFNEKYDGTFVLNTMSDMEHIHVLPTHQQGETIYYSPTQGNPIAAKIISVPLNDDSENYVIQTADKGDIIEAPKSSISTTDPNAPPPKDNDNVFPHIPWIKSGCKVTLYLNDSMPHPKQGTLIHSNDEWYFHQGRTLKHPPLHLRNFKEIAYVPLSSLVSSSSMYLLKSPSFLNLYPSSNFKNSSRSSFILASKLFFMRRRFLSISSTLSCWRMFSLRRLQSWCPYTLCIP